MSMKDRMNYFRKDAEFNNKTEKEHVCICFANYFLSTYLGKICLANYSTACLKMYRNVCKVLLHFEHDITSIYFTKCLNGFLQN